LVLILNQRNCFKNVAGRRQQSGIAVERRIDAVGIAVIYVNN